MNAGLATVQGMFNEIASCAALGKALLFGIASAKEFARDLADLTPTLSSDQP